MADELADLQREAIALGIKVDGRWGIERLRVEIELVSDVQRQTEALGIKVAKPEPGELAAPDKSEFEDEWEAEEPPGVRAGGHIDRGDGRGWMIEE